MGTDGDSDGDTSIRCNEVSIVCEMPFPSFPSYVVLVSIPETTTTYRYDITGVYECWRYLPPWVVPCARVPITPPVLLLSTEHPTHDA